MEPASKKASCLMWGKEWAVPEPAPQTYFLAEIVADFGCGIIFGG
jgi:hypothetical protein